MKTKSKLGNRRSCLLLVAFVLLSGMAAADFFVSPQGNDANPGTQDKPFASPEAARDAVRVLAAAKNLPAGGVTVWLAGGDYPRTKSFELAAADSGTPEAPIVYRAAEKQTVRLLGGRAISGLAPVADPAVLARLDEKARGKVLSVDLKALGVTDFGQLRSRGFGRSTTPAHLELFFAGKPMTLARWPNEGQFEKIASIPPESGPRRRPRRQNRRSQVRLLLRRRSAKTVEIPRRYLGSRLLVLGLGQLLRKSRIHRPRKTPGQNPLPARPLRLPPRPAFLLPQHPRRTRRARRILRRS